jgi:hypothetical protein
VALLGAVMEQRRRNKPPAFSEIYPTKPGAALT